MKRTLRLHAETLAELTPTELGEVAAAAGQESGLSCPLVDCLGFTFPPRCASGVTCPVTV